MDSLALQYAYCTEICNMDLQVGFQLAMLKIIFSHKYWHAVQVAASLLWQLTHQCHLFYRNQLGCIHFHKVRACLLPQHFRVHSLTRIVRGRSATQTSYGPFAVGLGQRSDKVFIFTFKV
jgi:hypothetical protein